MDMEKKFCGPGIRFIWQMQPSALAVLLKGKTILEDSVALGNCVETAALSHLAAHCDSNGARFSYWRNAKEKEADFLVEREGRIVPFEIKYQSQTASKKELAGILDFCSQKPAIEQGYVLTKSPQDLGALKLQGIGLLCIPACLFCYWLGESQVRQKKFVATCLINSFCARVPACMDALLKEPLSRLCTFFGGISGESNRDFIILFADQ